jgi:hypothetical protein
MVLGMSLAKWPVVARAVFRPFADWFQSKHGRFLLYGGFGLLMLVLAITWRFGFAAHTSY